MENNHGHPAGQGNIQVFGLDINAPVFVTSGIVALAFVVGALIFQDRATEVLGTLRVWITTQFDWLFMSACNICALFLLLSDLIPARQSAPRRSGRGSPILKNHLVLDDLHGGSRHRPAVLRRTGTRPLYYFQNPPLGIDPSDTKAAQAIGISAATFHWGTVRVGILRDRGPWSRFFLL